MQRRILVSTTGYLPGYKAGGPIRSVSRLVEQSREDIKIVTPDRDLGDRNPYPESLRLETNSNRNESIYYLHSSTLNILSSIWGFREWKPELIYLNSLFSPHFSILIALAVRLGLIGKPKIALAPRGELSRGALAIKPLKKRLAKPLLKLLYRRQICWHLSSVDEQQDLFNWWGSSLPAGHTFLVEEPPAIPPIGQEVISGWFPANHEILTLGYIGRISRKKNVLDAIECLRNVEVPTLYQVYGPIEDSEYWDECTERAGSLPPHIKLEYCGSLLAEDVQSTFESFDLFLFPTNGENFGHSIAESLSVGCPVICSSATPWTDMLEAGAGYVADGIEELTKVVNLVGSLTPAELADQRHRTLEHYRQWWGEQSDHRGTFERMLNSGTF